MWSVLVGLIERWWREKPRLDVVRAIVELRSSMMACQTSYEHYLRTVQRGDDSQGGSEALRAKTSWVIAIERLGRALLEMNDILGIFAPALHRSLNNYLSDERASGPTVMLLDEKGGDQRAQYSGLADMLKSLEWIRAQNDDGHNDATFERTQVAYSLDAPVGIEALPPGFDPDFHSALSELERFIRENFKPEEVWAASGRWR